MFKRKILSMVLLAGMLFGQPVPRVQAAICDHVQFVSDLTAPDGTTFAPGATFTKTWRLKNIGTCTWTTAYHLVWVGGDAIGAPGSLLLPANVAPGKTLDISVKLTAPGTAGNYKGLWKLSNASGAQFGIGNSAGDPFWVNISVAQVNAVIYDFVANAQYAQWKSGAGALPFPVTGGDDRGYAYQINNPHLEDDSLDAVPGLMTVPQNKTDGYISATYPEIQIQTGDQLQTLVNCEFAATSCYVTFRIDYRLSNGTQRTLWTWKEAYDKKFYRANINLNSLAGQKVQFVFMLLATGSASGDRAIWGSPRILRTGTTLPPAPPPTLTLLPPPAPTLTPFSSPPPTVAPAGCDKATFVADVTVPDGTLFSANTAFIKTWRLKNSGSCTWTNSYKLVFYSGEQMSAPTTINVPRTTAPGATVDLTVNMQAPTNNGKYRGYWILSNAAGKLFGIGTDASKPIWVEVNVSGASPTAMGYDFAANACSAQWKSGAGILPCPGTEGDLKGYNVPKTSNQMEDGSMGPAPALLVAPELKYNGYIQGVYPLFTVLPGDHFRGSMGCAYGSNCYVTFRLDYMTTNGTIKTFATWRESNDKLNHSVDVNLAPLAGQNVRFILTLLATGSATNDKATWIAPYIQRLDTSGQVPPTVTPVNTPVTMPGTIIPSPYIRKLYMFDSLNGWALGNYVLRTNDGGVTWYNVTMPGVQYVGNAFFQNATRGWVFGPSPDMQSTVGVLFRTTDGGRTWTQYNTPFNGGFIQFINDANGFALSGNPSGMFKQAVDLYQTTDGGATWVRKYTNNPLDPSAGTGLPFSGIKEGMTFRDTLRGWVGGESPLTGSVYIYKTNDSGTTWAQQTLSLPSGYSNAPMSTYAPMFFNANDGVLPVWMSLDVGKRDLYIYVTRDGGTTWTRSTGFARQGWNADFVSVKDGFTWNINGYLQVTHNTGGSWTQVASNVNFGDNIPIMDFVSTTTGWAVQNSENGATSLYRTTNGGATWTLLSGSTQALPELSIETIRIELQNTSCLAPNDTMGVRVWIKNNGQAAAGSFVVTVNNIQQTVNGLGVGETTPLFFATSNNPVTAVVDSTNVINESNETNNTRSEMVPIPTPPLPCVTSTPNVPQDFNTFGPAIVTALNARNFETAKSLMDETFMFAFWQSQGTSYPANLAIEQLRTNFLSATPLASDPTKDLNTLLDGLNPYAIMGLDPAKSQGLFVSGWGLDGKGEAIFYMTRLADGSIYWHSVLSAPTGFKPPVTLKGPYAVINVTDSDVLNIRSGAGASQPIVGFYPPDATDVMQTGASSNVDGAVWVEVRRGDGLTGWVNSFYLTEYVTRDAFCADTRVTALIGQVKQSMVQSNGNSLKPLVSPAHGVNMHLWAYGPGIKFTQNASANIYADTTNYDWGGGPSGLPDVGTFKNIVQPKYLEVFNAANMETYCDNLTKVYPLYRPWPYENIHYYNLYKPASDLFFDFRTLLIGIEYINGQPYLYGMVTVIWEP